METFQVANATIGYILKNISQTGTNLNGKWLIFLEDVIWKLQVVNF